MPLHEFWMRAGFDPECVRSALMDRCVEGEPAGPSGDLWLGGSWATGRSCPPVLAGSLFSLPIRQ